MKEIWKDVKGYEGRYKVSNLGRIKSLEGKKKDGTRRPEKILNPAKVKGKYQAVHLTGDNGYRTESVHRIVAEAFVERLDPSYNIVNHLDNDPSNNRADNLEWTTYEGNMQWAAVQGRMKGCPENLRKAQAARKKAVYAIDKNGNRLFFSSQSDAAKVLGIQRNHIGTACRKEYGYKKIGGYEFEYASEEDQETAKPKRVKMPDEQRMQMLRERMKGNTYGKGKKPSQKNIQASKEKLGKRVLQFDRDNNFIKEFFTANEAYKETGISHIDDVANGKRKTAGGFIWRWKEEHRNE